MLQQNFPKYRITRGAEIPSNETTAAVQNSGCLNNLFRGIPSEPPTACIIATVKTKTVPSTCGKALKRDRALSGVGLTPARRIAIHPPATMPIPSHTRPSNTLCRSFTPYPTRNKLFVKREKDCFDLGDCFGRSKRHSQ